ncbi:hypothetical protein Agub_g3426 [Astrephomene gubernaculifera]|uniref:Protein kinase domain-containing protein n=1 Tax=Astrephomene gubernaculifera TaxID=47775 RepID=A0AAD3DMG3_9CHLO|nr:hypothetical protein Agub_g3426 [Astrephomene gubernaculifera]
MCFVSCFTPRRCDDARHATPYPQPETPYVDGAVGGASGTEPLARGAANQLLQSQAVKSYPERGASTVVSLRTRPSPDSTMANDALMSTSGSLATVHTAVTGNCALVKGVGINQLIAASTQQLSPAPPSVLAHPAPSLANSSQTAPYRNWVSISIDTVDMTGNAEVPKTAGPIIGSAAPAGAAPARCQSLPLELTTPPAAAAPSQQARPAAPAYRLRKPSSTMLLERGDVSSTLPPQPQPPVGAMLDLSRVRDHVTELRPLYIRPGAALLLGKATASGEPLVARFERGRPDMLLAPPLLHALQHRRPPHHANVLSMLGVYTVQLSPPRQLRLPNNAPPALPALAPIAIPSAPAAASTEGASREVVGGCDDGNDDEGGARSNGAEEGGMDGEGESEAPGTWSACEDLLTATLALQQAGSGGARSSAAGGGCARTAAGGDLPGAPVVLSTAGVHGGSAAAAAGMTATCSARLRRAMQSPQVLLRDVVGHLREGGGAQPMVGENMNEKCSNQMGEGGLGRRASAGGEGAGSCNCGGHGVEEAAVDACDGSGFNSAREGRCQEEEGEVAGGGAGGGGCVGGSGSSCGGAAALATLCLSELCSGGNLFDEARRGAFKCLLQELYDRASHAAIIVSDADLFCRVERFIATAREVAQGLRYLHSEYGIAHGDLVSRNVLLQRHTSEDDPWVTRGYSAKLAGYGRLEMLPTTPTQPAPPSSSWNKDRDSGGGGTGATAATAGGSSGEVASSCLQQLSATSLARVNTVHVGLWRDVHSLAPERLLDPHAPPTCQADVYSYGTVLYEMAMGEAPWADMTPACVAVGAATGDFRIRCRQPLAAPSIAALIEWCTSPRPQERPSLQQVLGALAALEAEVGEGRKNTQCVE